jgi:hypothetical protein
MPGRTLNCREATDYNSHNNHNRENKSLEEAAHENAQQRHRQLLVTVIVKQIEKK